MRLDRDFQESFRLYSRLTAGTAAGALAAILLAGVAIVASLHQGAAAQPWLNGAIGVLSGLALTVAASQLWLRASLKRTLKAQRAALAAANTDVLTEALSRSYFLARFKQSVRGAPGAVGYMQIDLDHLKVLNDSYGHAAGDAALVRLVAVARALWPEAAIGRLGGDEFGLLIGGCSSRGELEAGARVLLQRFAEPVIIGGRQMRLSATIGFALAEGESADELMSRADLALYAGKRAGRGRAVGFDQDMLVDLRHRRFIERELRAAVLMNELELHYQPIMALDGVTPTAFEALVRWRHPVRGMIPPAQFIPIAEQSELIDRVGEWVLRRVCRDLDALAAPVVSVNVSPAQLRRAEFAQGFARILKESGTPGSRLMVEITESVALRSDAVEMRNIEALRALGVAIAIDDFGSGHASLEYLKKFPFDIIKIDRGYVANLATSRVDAVLVTAICEVGRSLGLRIVAEGVETEEQLALLKATGCTDLQGYLLGRPAPLGRKRIAAAA